MGEPYTIRILVPDGDPEGAKIIELLNWTGVGIAFPRSCWPQLRGRDEFKRSGIYVLTGPTEGTDDELPTVYVGQGDGIGARIEAHHAEKDFWDWCFAFVSKGNVLNRAHITWLEHTLLELAKRANRCHLDNANQPKEPGLSEPDRADTQGFLREMLRILPLLGVRVFEKPTAVATPGTALASPSIVTPADVRDTVVVPAQISGFTDRFLGENAWYAIRIGGGMLEKIKYIAAYQCAPVQAITHYARVDRIEPYGDDGKYRLIFTEPAKPLPQPIPFADAPLASMMGPKYTSLARLLSAKKVADLLASAKNPSDV
ncbi:MAG: GIY-YIG nuclease family protein [Planctomycetota bacterium]|nr:MAG: GIY-YIG nuclease family protein [Planctomycetota bacterium]